MENQQAVRILPENLVKDFEESFIAITTYVVENSRIVVTREQDVRLLQLFAAFSNFIRDRKILP